MTIDKQSLEYFYGLYVGDKTDFFTRSECHVKNCKRNKYINGLCKLHKDLENYRLETERLHNGTS